MYTTSKCLPLSTTTYRPQCIAWIEASSTGPEPELEIRWQPCAKRWHAKILVQTVVEVVVCRERPGLPPDRLRPAGRGGPDEAAGLRLRRYGPTPHLISRFAIFGRPFLHSSSSVVVVPSSLVVWSKSWPTVYYYSKLLLVHGAMPRPEVGGVVGGGWDVQILVEWFGR